jgi:hypothetical protein
VAIFQRDLPPPSAGRRWRFPNIGIYLPGYRLLPNIGTYLPGYRLLPNIETYLPGYRLLPNTRIYLPGYMLLPNIGTYLSGYTLSHPRDSNFRNHRFNTLKFHLIVCIVIYY